MFSSPWVVYIIPLQLAALHMGSSSEFSYPDPGMVKVEEVVESQDFFHQEMFWIWCFPIVGEVFSRQELPQLVPQ